MVIVGFEKLSLLDYPGKISTVLYTYGCSLRCPYCGTPDLVVCPLSSLRRYSEEEIVEELIKSRGQTQSIVITGGEPVLQSGLIDFLRKIKDLGYLVKLDTYGLNPRKLQQVLDTNLVDYWSMEVKGDIELYRRCGYPLQNLQNIDESIRIIKSQAPEYEFKTTVLKGDGWHTPEVMQDVADRIAGASNYYLQNFKPGKHLDQGFSESNSFTASELCSIQTLFVNRVEHLGVRG